MRPQVNVPPPPARYRRLARENPTGWPGGAAAPRLGEETPMSSDEHDHDASALRRLTDSSGLIIAYPAAVSDRLVVLRALAARIAPGQIYTEHEINELIQRNVHPDAVDHVTLRRDLIDYQFIQRTDRGTRYWRIADSRGVPPRIDLRWPYSRPPETDDDHQ
jgi:hypothetical protein